MPIRGIGKYTDSSRTQVRLNSGQIVSRADAENRYAQSQGYRSDYERRQAYRESRESKVYEKELQAARDRDISRAEFREVHAKMMHDYRQHGSGMDRSPNGPLAQYLEAMGRRQTGLDYNVGETPSVR